MNKEGNTSFIRFYRHLIKFYKFSVTVKDMPVIIGTRENSKRVKVQSIWYQLNQHPEGYGVEAEKIPEYPPSKPGINHVMYFNPQTQEFWFEEQERPLTREELEMDEVKEKYREEGREEIRRIVREAAEMPELSSEARQKLEEKGVLSKQKDA